MLTVVFVKDDFQKSIGLSSMLKNVCSALKTDDKGRQPRVKPHCNTYSSYTKL